MNDRYVFENTPLPYPYDAMEPYLDTETMRLHYGRHLQTYVDNLNKALKDHPRLQRLSLEELIVAAGRLPPPLRNEIGNNAGGVYNHRFYFRGLERAGTGGMPAAGALADAITAGFGGLTQFKQLFKSAALSVFGSGYAWLVSDRLGRLSIITTANQNTPLTERLCPILTVDVWEHAYYLKYQNRRSEYLDAWFHVINWSRAGANYAQCRNGGTAIRL